MSHVPVATVEMSTNLRRQRADQRSSITILVLGDGMCVLFLVHSIVVDNANSVFPPTCCFLGILATTMERLFELLNELYSDFVKLASTRDTPFFLGGDLFSLSGDGRSVRFLCAYSSICQIDVFSFWLLLSFNFCLFLATMNTHFFLSFAKNFLLLFLSLGLSLDLKCCSASMPLPPFTLDYYYSVVT
mmetsp:Transcript_14665/g.29805  ORF Transcript_14665/g.29805 Transcript_14665/m.29805 type:complete len:188 (+) Transcript_14665:288-851(+)